MQQLVDAGASVVGKTITDELAYSLAGTNVHYGTPTNVNAPGHAPGGSSAGSAAAVAAGLVDLAIGTDTGGSIRAPASYCGIYGWLLMHGAVSVGGVVPLAPGYDTVGLFAAIRALLASAAAVVLLAAPVTPPPVRIVVPAEPLGEVGADLVEQLLALAHRLGVVAEPLPLGVDLGAAVDAFRTLQGAEAWATHGDWITETNPNFGGIAARFAAAWSPRAGRRSAPGPTGRHQRDACGHRRRNVDSDAGRCRAARSLTATHEEIDAVSGPRPSDSPARPGRRRSSRRGRGPAHRRWAPARGGSGRRRRHRPRDPRVGLGDIPGELGRSATDRQPVHPQRGHPVAHRNALAVLATRPGRTHGEVGAHRVDVLEHCRAVPDEVPLPQRLGDLPALYEVRLGHAEDEVAGGGVDLTSTEVGDVDPGLGVGHDVVGIGVTTHQVGVGHPHHRKMLVALPPTVARRSPGPRPGRGIRPTCSRRGSRRG